MSKGSIIAVAALGFVGMIGAKLVKKRVKKDSEESKESILVDKELFEDNLLLERKKRKTRVRENLKKNNINGHPRLSVFRSNKNIYAQLIDDKTGTTIASASSLALNIKGSDIYSAAVIGKVIGELALKKGVTEVVFDRGPYPYHGRVKALAESAREAGLKF